MKVLISGGCKNGKSTIAQDMAVSMSKGGRLYYVATMLPKDEEDRRRVRRHVLERDGMGFETVEQPVGISGILDICSRDGTFLIDSVTALLENEMFPEGGKFDRDCAQRIAEELEQLCTGIENAVFVSDYIYSDAVEYDEWTERYRASQAVLDRTLARCCDLVIEVSAGIPVIRKGASRR